MFILVERNIGNYEADNELLAIKLNQAFWYMNLIEAVQCLNAQDANCMRVMRDHHNLLLT